MDSSEDLGDYDNGTDISKIPSAIIHLDDIKKSMDPDSTENVSKKKIKKLGPTYLGVGGEALPPDVLNSITQFLQKQKKGFIDVWWLYDDGGMIFESDLI